MKVFIVVGTRPEAIKMAPVVAALRAAQEIEVRLVATAQHRHLLDQTLAAFNLTADYDLDVMAPKQNLSGIVARVLDRLTELLKLERPDLVLVHGDTTTTFSASLASFHLQIPIGHVEAGLRTGNLFAPFPEEANRIMTDRLSQLHFVPTAVARETLLREDIPAASITVTGNTVIDALLWMRERVAHDYRPSENVFGSAARALAGTAPILLVTAHRRENFGDGFEHICAALATLSQRFPDWHIVYPVHLNPNVQEPVRRILGGYANVHLVPPLDYRAFVWLMDRSRLVLTDSGGVQEEAPSLGKPVLVMRAVTERPEAVDAGTAILVGTDSARIVETAAHLITDNAAYARMASAHNPYGDGRAAERILKAIRAWERIR